MIPALVILSYVFLWVRLGGSRDKRHNHPIHWRQASEFYGRPVRHLSSQRCDRTQPKPLCVRIILEALFIQFIPLFIYLSLYLA